MKILGLQCVLIFHMCVGVLISRKTMLLLKVFEFLHSVNASKWGKKNSLIYNLSLCLLTLVSWWELCMQKNFWTIARAFTIANKVINDHLKYTSSEEDDLQVLNGRQLSYEYQKSFLSEWWWCGRREEPILPSSPQKNSKLLFFRWQ